MKNIKRLRKILGLTQAEFAKSLMVSRTTVTMWETENREPDYTMLSQIAEKYGVSTDFLIGCGLFSNWEEIMSHRKEILDKIATLAPEIKNISQAADNELLLIRAFGALFKQITIQGEVISLVLNPPFGFEVDSPSPH